MDCVYLVFDDIHGLQCICKEKEKAKEMVKNIAFNQYDLPKDTPLDYNTDSRWGWESISWYDRVGVN